MDIVGQDGGHLRYVRLVAAYINQSAGVSVRKRQSLIPDFTISFVAGRPGQLGELKFIGQQKSEKFFPSDKKEGERCSGVGKRVGTVNADYLRNARQADIVGGRLPMR